MAAEPVGPQTVPVPETPIPQAPLSPVGRPMDTADKKAIRFALWDFSWASYRWSQWLFDWSY